MLIPLSTDVPVRRTPWVNYVLIGLNVVVYLLADVLLAGPRTSLIKDNLLLYADGPRWYQFLTSMFLHGGLFHLGGNMVFLWVFGNALNNKMGNAVYLLFYLSCGLFAGIGYVLFRSAPVLGASGAIFGVAAGFLVLFPSSRVVTLYFFFFIGLLELSGLTIVGFYLAYNLFYLLLGSETGTAYLAHLGGALFGVVSSLLLLATGGIGRDSFDLLAMIKRWRQRRSWHAYAADPDVQARARYGRVARPVRSVELGSQPDDDLQAQRVAELRYQIGQAIAAGDSRDAGRLYSLLRSADPHQVLPPQQQLDLGNYLMSDGQHPQAADVYEALLTRYPAFESRDQVELLLGLLYSRYLDNPVRARHFLERARRSLRDPNQQAMCDEELEKVRQSLGD